MEAYPSDLYKIFGKNVRYIVPLYQRPYVWNAEENWEPLWQDIMDAVARVGRADKAEAPPHFLGAVVLSQLTISSKEPDSRLVIDGQQRLTTLQLFLAAARAAAAARGFDRAEALLTEMSQNNPKVYDADSDLIFKVWPTNADRGQFSLAMRGQPIDGRIGEAYQYFGKVIEGWLDGASDAESAMDDMVFAVRTALSLVVIDLAGSDDAQTIFETLNHRGRPLLAADLIKNHLFRAVLKNGGDGEQLYRRYWAPFDEDAWRKEVGIGRVYRPKIDIFLWHWLTMRTEREISVTGLYTAFAKWFDDEAAPPAEEVFEQLARFARIYEGFDCYPFDSVEGRFFYRLRVQQVTTAMPLLLFLYGLHPTTLSRPRLLRALKAIDTFLMRRAVCMLSTKDYNNVFRALLADASREPEHADDAIIRSLRSEKTPTRRTPTDSEFRSAIEEKQLYGDLSQSRIRILLEGIEDRLRTGLTEKLVVPFGEHAAEKLTIEHVMPRSWRKYWPLDPDAPEDAADERDRLVNCLGNLTLLTDKLNPKLSNAGWETKRKQISEHSLLRITTGSILNPPRGYERHDWADTWNEARIRIRGSHLADLAVSVWSLPAVDEMSDEPEVDETQAALEYFSETLGGVYTELGELEGRVDDAIAEFAHETLQQAIGEATSQLLYAGELSENLRLVLDETSPNGLEGPADNAPASPLDGPPTLVESDLPALDPQSKSDYDSFLENLRERAGLCGGHLRALFRYAMDLVEAVMEAGASGSAHALGRYEGLFFEVGDEVESAFRLWEACVGELYNEDRAELGAYGLMVERSMAALAAFGSTAQ